MLHMLRMKTNKWNSLGFHNFGIDDNINNVNLSYVSPSNLNFGTKEFPWYIHKICLILITSMVSVQSTERVEAIYPLLKDMAISPDMLEGSNTMKQ
ncbi:hypothetical protein HID58_057127, partial [Brassica napus]